MYEYEGDKDYIFISYSHRDEERYCVSSKDFATTATEYGMTQV